MSSTTRTQPDESKQEESMQQNPTAPPVPMGPPPTYNEAMNSSPYPPMPIPASQPAYPMAAPYPVTDSTMPLPVMHAPTAPYPIEGSAIPVPMTDVPVASPYNIQTQAQPMGFVNTSPPHHYNQPIVNQPATAYNEEYVHPKTYVVLQNHQSRRRDDDDCSCTDWMMCCWCCVETCRCLLLCFECAAACK